MFAFNLNEIFSLAVFVFGFVANSVITNRISFVAAATATDESSSMNAVALGVVVDKFAINSSNYFENIERDNNNFNNIVNMSIFDSVNYNNNDNVDDDDNALEQQGSGSIAVKERKLRRGKRYLDFVKGTRVSWRTTVKNNILKINTLWGYGFGFRSNFPFPDKADRLRPFFKRDLLHATIDMLNGHGLDGRACILKSYCMAQLDGETPIGGGMIFKLLKMLLSLDHHEKRHFPYLNMDNCHQILHSHCPLSFNSISPYTDDV